MYTRSYNDTEHPGLPPHYDGTAFSEMQPEQAREEVIACESEPVGAGVLSGLFGGDILGKIKMPELRTEEILLLAAAAFLFFSKDGDKECAILILLLVFLW